LVDYWDKYTEMHGQQNVKVDFLVRTSEKFPGCAERTALQCHDVRTFSISLCYQFISTVIAKNSWITGPVSLRLDNLSHPTLKWTRIPFLMCILFFFVFCFIFCVGDVLCTLYQVLYPGLIVTITGPDHLPSNDSARERKREDVLTTELVSMATDAVSSPVRPWANDCDRFLRVIFFLTSFIVILKHHAYRRTSPWFTVNIKYYDDQHFILFDPEKLVTFYSAKLTAP